MQISKNRIYLLLACSIFFITTCNAQSTNFVNMNSSEKDFNQRQAKVLVAYMTLDTMFPDKSIRALADAAGKGKVKKVEALISSGVDVNSRGTSSATPLFWALRSNNVEGFKRLLELGADPNVIFDDGGNVIIWSIRNKSERFLEESLRHGGNPNLISGQFNETPLFKSASPGGKSKASILLDAGADINAQRLSGDTPVMVAAGLGQFDVVYELLERGADYNIKNTRGDDLLDIIAFRKKTMDPTNELTRWMEKVLEWIQIHREL